MTLQEQIKLEKKRGEVYLEIEEQITEIRKGITRLFESDPDWGTIGSLNQVKTDLRETAEFLNN